MKVIATNSFFKSFRISRISDTWFKFKRAIWALYKYFRITTKMVPWDYGSILEMMKFQITILANYLEEKGIEVEKDRLPKIEKMRRFIELADNHIKNDYGNRCGFNYENNEFVLVEENLYEFKAKDDDIDKMNEIAIKNSNELEEKEWNEMTEILKDMNTWWD